LAAHTSATCPFSAIRFLRGGDQSGSDLQLAGRQQGTFDRGKPALARAGTAARCLLVTANAVSAMMAASLIVRPQYVPGAWYLVPPG